MKALKLISVLCLAVSSCAGKPDASLYSWEAGRTKAPSFSDMVLCYGGSPSRRYYAWDEKTFEPFVTYVDRNGEEHWLFDAFLALEFSDMDADSTLYALMADQVDGPSGSKENWQHMIDYWFAPGNGFDALDKTIESAKSRLGEPSSKRKVVMFMPDPIPYLFAKDDKSSHTYWGELDGRELDFLLDEDRFAAYRWYIDSVRLKWNEAGFRNLELIGFYVMSECITIPSEPWTDHGKLHDVIPLVSDYLHGVNECLYWIPFYRGAGWRRGRELGFDYVWMQPNHYWRGDACPMDVYAELLREEGIGMEFEFDSRLFEGKPLFMEYRRRFQEYIDCAKAEGIYGSQPITYYVDASFCLGDLSRSQDPGEKEFYHNFCQFVINNPLRNEK